MQPSWKTWDNNADAIEHAGFIVLCSELWPLPDGATRSSFKSGQPAVGRRHGKRCGCDSEVAVGSASASIGQHNETEDLKSHSPLRVPKDTVLSRRSVRDTGAALTLGLEPRAMVH